MTRVSRIARKPGYELCRLLRPADVLSIDSLVDGHTRRAEWPDIAVELVQVDDSTESEGRGSIRLLHADAPWLASHALVFRVEAIERLGLPLSTHGELLPLRCSSAELALYNPLSVVDCLDEGASDVARTKSGLVWRIRRYVFRSDAVPADSIFKVPNIRSSPVFVSGALIDLIRAASPQGIELFDA